MTFSVFGGGSSSYTIQRSLRFRSSASAYLSRTPASSGNTQKWTYSCWVKMGQIGTWMGLLNAGTSGPQTVFYLYADSTLYYQNWNGSTNNGLLQTTQLFRDPSAWYHLVLVIDIANATANNRQRIYVNGQEVTSFISRTNHGTSDNTIFNNSSYAHNVGLTYQISSTAPKYFDGYLAEVNFIDGQALTPSSFGQTDPVTGVWAPKKYTGTYGTNGFYLDFKNNTSATTLAQDKSGNGNNWTPNNISTTAGDTYDSMLDVPTLTSETAANFAVLNPLSNSSALRNGNLSVYNASTYSYTGASTIAVSSGKWYCEFPIVAAFGYFPRIGILPVTENPSGLYGPGYSSTSYGISAYDGSKYNNNSPVAYGTPYTNGDTIMCALDMDNGKVYWGKNGTWFNSGSPETQTNPAFTGLTGLYCFGAAAYLGECAVNFGQRPFSYTPPTGFKALNTFNLPDPTIKKPNQYMDATLYTGNGSTQSIVNAAGFQPDLVWNKSRSVAASHELYDSVRGATNRICSNLTQGEDVVSGVTSFNANGYSLGSGTGSNSNGNTFVGWQWKKGATPGFDIVTYTGTGSARTVSHSLGVKPAMMILKNRSTAGTSWKIYHSTLGATKILLLDSTSEALTSSSDWNNTEPTSSVFTVGTNAGTNENTKNIVAYLFAEIAGFSKFGSYTGNGSADGPFVFCGFRPRFVLIKRTDAVNQWGILDTVRNTYNTLGNYLIPSSSAAEETVYLVDLLSNGFKPRVGAGYALNDSGGTYIFAAFAENPLKYSLAR